MAKKIKDIIKALASLENEIAGVARAHDETPDDLREFPCFINYLESGTLQLSSADHGLYTIIAELRVSKSNLIEAEKEARPFIERFRDKMASNLSLNSTVDVINEIRFRYGTLPPLGGQPHLGIRFEVDVKVKDTITPEL